ncbi:MAG TPA: mechanosensitive ion channel domain-containing protein [Sphingomonadaceae bacterium]|nr:mechanosensitive ion channel domain-containing protein [Sphingomonadaceae bacterium]
MNLSQKTTALQADAAVWIADHGVDILLGVLFTAIVAGLLYAARSIGTSLFCRTGSRWGAVVAATLRRTYLFFVVAVSAKVVSAYWPAPAPVERAIQIAFVVTLAIQAAVWAREIILGIVETRAGERPGETTVGNALRIIRLLVNVALFAIATVLILSNLGVDVTGIVAGLGIGGIAIGLAARDIFSDLFAALAIILDRPFRLGQTVKFGDTVGTVEAIGLKTTRLRSVDGDEVIVANAKLLDREIRNLADVHDRRVVLVLPLLNRNDPAALATLAGDLRPIVEAHADARFVHAWLTHLGAVTVDLELMFRVETESAERMMEVRHTVVLAALERVRTLGLELNGPWPAPVSAP